MLWKAVVGFDDFMIDRVFQPVADRWNQYALAEFVFTGAVVFYLPGAWHRRSWIIGSLVVLGWSWWTLKARAMIDRPVRNVLPLERVTGVAPRCGLVIMQFASGSSLWFDHTIWRVTAEVSWWLGITGMYLMACRPHPPRPVRQVREVIA